MKIALAAGAVGGYFGARLHAAGEDVWFLPGAPTDAMHSDGLTRDACGEERFDGVRATDDPAEIGPVDIVLFAVKLDTRAGGPRRQTADRPRDGADLAAERGRLRRPAGADPGG